MPGRTSLPLIFAMARFVHCSGASRSNASISGVTERGCALDSIRLSYRPTLVASSTPKRRAAADSALLRRCACAANRSSRARRRRRGEPGLGRLLGGLALGRAELGDELV